MRTAWIWLCVLGTGCGAKTELEQPIFGFDACRPRAEVCNGVDDDCDGSPDDGLTCFFLDGSRLEAFAGEACGAAWYSYDEPDSESANPTPDIRRSDTVVVGTQWNPSCEGANVGLIVDLPMDGSGGRLDVEWQVSPPGSARLLVSDEPNECTHDALSGQGGCAFRWNLCCTDGFLLGPWSTNGCVTLTVWQRDDPERGPGVREMVVLDGERGAEPRAFGIPFTICAEFRDAVD